MKSPSGRGGGFAARIALRQAGIGLAVGLVATVVSWFLVRGEVDRGLEARLARSLTAASAATQSYRAELLDSLRSLDRELRVERPELTERLWRAELTAGAAASDLARLAGLDRLEILDDDGRIVSSWRGGARVGLEDRALLELPPDQAVLRPTPLAGETGVEWTARHDLVLASRTLILVGAVELGEAWLEASLPGEAAWLVGSEAVLARNRSASIGPFGRTPPASSVDFLVGTVELDPADSSDELRFIVAVDRAPATLRLRRLTLILLAVAGGAALLGGALGYFGAGRVGRSVNELIAAVDAIGAGAADYDLTERGGDEFDALAASFSRLHRSLERQRRRSAAAERVAAWREVARHVAHEVKNPLAPIRLTVQNLVRARSRAPERFDDLFAEGTRTILEEVDQLDRLVSEFSTFARLPAPVLCETRLDELIERVVELHRAEDGIQIDCRLDPELPLMRLDPDQIARAMKNVVGNAVDAIREAGAAGTLRLRCERSAGFARIEVADDGPGFDEEAARRIFEPYFTTKGSGTGLGMAITQRIISEHGGFIEAENRDRGGARVVIHLPLAAAEPTPETERNSG